MAQDTDKHYRCVRRDADASPPCTAQCQGCSFLECFQAVPSAKKASGWISVKDRLPDIHEEVLLYHCIGDSRGGDHAIDVAWRSLDKDGKDVWGFPWDRAAKSPAPRWAVAWMPIEQPEGM